MVLNKKLYRSLNEEADVMLHSVVTCAEACRMWKQYPSNIITHIETGNLVGRKSSGVWIVTVQSLRDYFGLPVDDQFDY